MFVESIFITFGQTAVLPTNPFKIKLNKNIYIGLCRDVSRKINSIRVMLANIVARYAKATTVSKTYLAEPIPT